MIVEFSVKNFRSIKDLQTISFVATKLKSNQEKYLDVDVNNIVVEGESEMRLLKTIGIYGANASGKSNIIKAMVYFFRAIYDLPSPESRLALLADPFLFQENSIDTESFFQIVLIIDEKKYRYGFTVKKANSIGDKNPISVETDAQIKESSKEIITSEWLYGPKEKNQVKYFLRKDLSVEKDNIQSAKNIPDLQYRHSLFLTHAASFDRGVCARIRDFIRGFTISNETKPVYPIRNHTLNLLFEDNTKKELLNFLSTFQLNYDDITFEEQGVEKGKDIPPDKIFFTKAIINSNKNVRLNLQNSESAGTQKLFDLAGLLMLAFRIKVGGLIVLDELDSNFHPALVIKLIKMFNDSSINKANAQLLFTSHDTNILDPSIMRRDQFYFAEKDDNDATRLYSLADLNGIRNDADFAKQYLAGYYGAVPVLLKEYSNKISEKNDRTLES